MQLLESGEGEVLVRIEHGELTEWARTACEFDGLIPELEVGEIRLELGDAGDHLLVWTDLELVRARRKGPAVTAAVREVMSAPLHPIAPGEVLRKHREVAGNAKET